MSTFYSSSKAQPYLETIVLALIAWATTVITGAIKKAQKRAEAYYNAHTNEKDRTAQDW
ncbi:hypothetical protein MKX40_22170 [Paenibacillus sp. FSL R5-0517]|uniref:hypothetical protein n=1 Tax=Paenibacillus sp. FSL R5-0517 TaxID=2921647 RepID=UPI0030D7C74A